MFPLACLPLGPAASQRLLSRLLGLGLLLGLADGPAPSTAQAPADDRTALFQTVVEWSDAK